MEKINIGKVCPIPKGEWNTNNDYEKLNIVSVNGESYIAKEDVPSSTDISNARYWMKITDKYSLSIGNVSTVSSSTQASASISYNSDIDNYELNLNIPKGEHGENGVVEKEFNILFIGNSLTQDGVAYLPYMLYTYYPEIKFKIYDWYIGGGKLYDHYQTFLNNNYVIENHMSKIFSVAENTPTWTNYSGNNDKTMAQILSEYQFDIVCIQPYFNYTESLNLTNLNNCINYIISNYKNGELNKNGLEFITLAHAPKRNNRIEIYDRVIRAMKLMLKDTIIDDLIPIGIAVDMACDTELNSLGDVGGLSPDGTHTQEGLPCLLQTYNILCWLFNKLGIPKSIYGHPMKMTTSIYNTINVPGANLGSGVISGTPDENLLAQEIAIKAYKIGKEFVIKNSSHYLAFNVSYDSDATGMVFNDSYSENSSYVSYNSYNSALVFTH